MSEAAFDEPQTLVIWSVGERIRKAREDHGWKQTDLAGELRVSRTTIGGWENNEHPASHLALRAISDLTGKPLWWLEGYDVQPSGGVPSLQDRRSRNRSRKPADLDEHWSRCTSAFARQAA